MSPEHGTKLGPYTLISALGSGGMGEVFTALDRRLDRYVAIKVLSSHLADDPTARARFDREAKAIAGLNHPNVCALFDVGHAKGHDYLVMELLEGTTLQARLLDGPLDLPSLVTYAIALADALDAAHERGLIHRDLKPANIFITTRDVPKILDFGLAKTLEASDPDLTRSNESMVTSLGTAVGTLAYMSPEQLRGEAVDMRTDVFSFGLVMYEMATGQRAFEGQTTAVISAAILTREPKAPRSLRRDLPARLEDMILKAIEKDRSRRYQTAAEFRSDLMRIQRDMSGLARPAVTTVPAAAGSPSTVEIEVPSALRASTPHRSSNWGRKILMVCLMLAGAAAGGSGGYWWWTERAHSAATASKNPLALQTPVTPSPEPVPSAPTPQQSQATDTATSVPPAPATTTPPPASAPPVAATPPSETETTAPPNTSAAANRGRAGRGLISPSAGASLASTLRSMPPQKYQIAFVAGQARDAAQLRLALNAGGWTNSGVQQTQEPVPASFVILVPRRSTPASALFDWAKRNGFNPEYRIRPELPEIRIIIGTLKER